MTPGILGEDPELRRHHLCCESAACHCDLKPLDTYLPIVGCTLCAAKPTRVDCELCPNVVKPGGACGATTRSSCGGGRGASIERRVDTLDAGRHHVPPPLGHLSGRQVRSGGACDNVVEIQSQVLVTIVACSSACGLATTVVLLARYRPCCNPCGPVWWSHHQILH